MEHAEVLILGAGFSGLCAAIELRRQGITSFLVLEKANDVGGTWRDNVYPGVECDVPSHLYSLSFALNPTWSKSFATGEEIHAYLRDCATRFDVRDRIVFGTRAVRARWGSDRWEVDTEDGRTFTARFLISGLGALHTPNVPDFPGMDGYRGTTFHTSCWDPRVVLAGRRVGMIGTGATAVQAAPEVANLAAEFYLFQRSAIWVRPKNDNLYSAEQQHRFTVDRYQLRRHRWRLWQKWEKAGIDILRSGTDANRSAELAARENIKHVKDPALVAALTPPYNITCKRFTYSNDYYPMFNRSNVHLVTDPIEGFEASGLACRSKVIPLDVVIFATGFKAFNITNEIDVVGMDGRRLAETWADRTLTYRSVMVHGFPNFFILLGPNSGGLTSAVQMIEAGVHFTSQAIRRLRTSDVVGLHPSEDEMLKFVEWIDEATSGTTLNDGCTSWWTRNGHNQALWPGSSTAFKMLLAYVHPDHFETIGGSGQRWPLRLTATER
jgi:cation diffusion facilitator CzcD-associated flavoprotein CzcO